MPRKAEAAHPTGLAEYAACDPKITGFSFEKAYYPVLEGKLWLTPEQAAPLLAVQAISPVYRPSAGETTQPSLGLPAE
jgi:hypothetical protein